MDPYAQAAFGFAKAYQMNMQAADQQRRANQPSTEAFTSVVADEDNEYAYSPDPRGAVPPVEQYSGVTQDRSTMLDQSNGNALTRAKQKVSKYLQERD